MAVYTFKIHYTKAILVIYVSINVETFSILLFSFEYYQDVSESPSHQPAAAAGIPAGKIGFFSQNVRWIPP